MNHIEFELITGDGLKLRGQGWTPPEAACAVVCLVHGHGEHSGRYAGMAEALGQAGFAMMTFDLRGHGLSQGKRGHAPSYETLMSDIALLLQEAASRCPALPCFLFGHSLGGNLVAYYVLKNRPSLAGVILSAPLFRLAYRPPKWKTALLEILYALHLAIPVSTGIRRSELTRDTEVLDRYSSDPLAHKRITPQLALDMLRYGEWILQHAAAFPLPVMLMHGRSDKVTSVEASMEFASRAGQCCTLEIWDGFYHEVHNEPEKEQIYDCVLDWMKQRI
ncbi:MAG TPA: lysophospholipase [Pontiella sp.]